MEHPQRIGGLVQAMMDLLGLSLPSREEERRIRPVELPRVSCVSA